MEASKYPFGKVVAGYNALHIRGLLHKESIPYGEINDVSVSKFFKRLSLDTQRGKRRLQFWSLEEAELLSKIIRENRESVSSPSSPEGAAPE
ncbi:MAG TPA: hypothetical protein VNL15_01050 [Dehalococcoidia bacterium]|nr:hypothetical protein [Dehalococcoidia bacterium]